jgi:hypothetical protein
MDLILREMVLAVNHEIEINRNQESNLELVVMSFSRNLKLNQLSDSLFLLSEDDDGDV